MYLGARCAESADRSEAGFCLDHDPAFPNRAYIQMKFLNTDLQWEEADKIYMVNLGSTLQIKSTDFQQAYLPEEMALFVFKDSTLKELTQEVNIPLRCDAGLHLSAQWGVFEVHSIEIYNGAFCQAVSAGVLPLSYLSFHAQSTAGGVDLNWILSGELFKGKVEIQHSSDGHYFEVLKTFEATAREYVFTHASPDQINFYRLKLFDERGAFSYSLVRFITYENTQVLSVFPNPVRNDLFVAGQSSNAEIYMFDHSGRFLVKETNPERIDMSAWPAGMYFISIRDKGERYQEKIIKNE